MTEYGRRKSTAHIRKNTKRLDQIGGGKTRSKAQAGRPYKANGSGT